MDIDPREQHMERLRRALAALGEPHRFRLALLMGERPRTVGELADAAELAQPLVSHHLSILSRAGLADSERRGRSSLYRLSDPEDQELRTLLDWVRDGVGHARSRASEAAELRDRPVEQKQAQARRHESEQQPEQDPEQERNLSRNPRGGEIEDYLL